MIWHIERFREITKDEGVLSAIRAVFRHIHLRLYKITGLREFIRLRLLVGGGSTISKAMYVKLYTPFLEKRIGSGVDVMKEDWDNLILLDAYRADYFRKYSSLEGELSTVVSKGDTSIQFVANNFQDEECHDTVVVTSNLWYQKCPEVDESTFFKLINPVGTENRTKTNPELVTEAALNAIEQFPNKRLIVHYMSPHTPHMGETADRIRNEFSEDYSRGMFYLYKRGEISKETLEQSYLETIRIIEDEVQELVKSLDGKTVVSSDHGENLGEVQHGMMHVGHGHPTPECRYVPWLEMENSERREITEDPPIGFDTMDEDAVEERLVALGYK